MSELDLSVRYTDLVAHTRAKMLAELNLLYQRQLGEEDELRKHDFVTDRKAKHLKEAYLTMAWHLPVLQTKMEIAWNEHRNDHPVALMHVKAVIVTYFTTQTAAQMVPDTKADLLTTGQQPPLEDRLAAERRHSSDDCILASEEQRKAGMPPGVEELPVTKTLPPHIGDRARGRVMSRPHVARGRAFVKGSKEGS